MEIVMRQMRYDNLESFDIETSFADLLKLVNLDSRDTGGAIVFKGSDPVLPSKHMLGTVMAFGRGQPRPRKYFIGRQGEDRARIYQSM